MSRPRPDQREPPETARSTSTRVLAGAFAGALLGIVVFGAIRMAALPAPDDVHYHANWALWIEGERVDLSADRYMEDLDVCAADPAMMTAPARVHMHENNADVVHVHHGAATWGHLMQNLDWGLGDDWIVTDEGEIYRAGDGARLTYVLNGMAVPPQHDRVIRPGDQLLISFGREDVEELVNERFPTVSSDAHEYDGVWEGAGCAAEPENPSFGERVRRAFWF